MRRVRSVTVRVACAQIRARPLARADRALADVVAAVSAAAAKGADIVVLPECAYPGYVLLKRNPFRGIPSAAFALRAIADAARRCEVNVCVGIALPGGRGGLRNEAVFIDRRGEEAARYAKFYLWNFDTFWFERGTSVPVFESEFGRLGMMICADGRMPEIARTLALRGAWLILDPTAWVAFGPSYDRMRNPQVDYMMRVRARENGVSIAAADKCGSENFAVNYVGQSMVVTPDGDIAALAAADRPALIVADVQRREPRPVVVSLTAAQRRTLGTVRRRRRRVRRSQFRLGVLQGPMKRAERAIARATLVVQSVDALIETAASARSVKLSLPAKLAAMSSVLAGPALLAPEPARAAALDGAEIVIWAQPPRDERVRDYARTRALENKVYVVVCARASDATPACVVDPAGNVVTEARAGAPSGFVAKLELARARDKSVVPGTDALAGRIPRAFCLPASDGS